MASLYCRHGVWHVALKVDGKRIYKSTGATRRTEALHFQAEFKTPPRQPQINLAAFLEDFWKFSLTTQARSTLEISKRAGRMFLDFLGDVPLASIKPLDVERYKNKRLKTPRRHSKTLTVKPVTVNIELRTLKSMFGYAMNWGVIEKTPFKGVTLVKIPEQAPRISHRGPVQETHWRGERPRPQRRDNLWDQYRNAKDRNSQAQMGAR
jgi:hypothetical protein